MCKRKGTARVRVGNWRMDIRQQTTGHGEATEEGAAAGE
jgi:hypothetical protein